MTGIKFDVPTILSLEPLAKKECGFSTQEKKLLAAYRDTKIKEDIGITLLDRIIDFITELFDNSFSTNGERVAGKIARYLKNNPQIFNNVRLLEKKSNEAKAVYGKSFAIATSSHKDIPLEIKRQAVEKLLDNKIESEESLDAKEEYSPLDTKTKDIFKKMAGKVDASYTPKRMLSPKKLTNTSEDTQPQSEKSKLLKNPDAPASFKYSAKKLEKTNTTSCSEEILKRYSGKTVELAKQALQAAKPGEIKRLQSFLNSHTSYEIKTLKYDQTYQKLQVNFGDRNDLLKGLIQWEGKISG